MRRKPMRFGTLAEYTAYFQGVKEGFIMGVSISIAIAGSIYLILRWLRIW
jgi:hypothetical protein